MDDTLLVERLKQGSEEAFEEFFELYKGRIFSVVYRILVDPTETEDVVQEVFLKALKNIGSFNQKSSLYTWLYRIAVNTGVDFKKKFRPKGVVSIQRYDGAAEEIVYRGEGPHAAPERSEMAQILRKTMDQLSEKHKTILVLREFEELTYEEISEVLQCSKGTVESRLFRARARLREKMERYL